MMSTTDSTHAQEECQRVRIPFFGKAGMVLAAFALAAVVISLVRFVWGIGSVTNLDDRYPWGLWIAFDVATGVALAAGGFTSAAVVYVFHKERYHALVRPALLTALLGYTFVVLALLVDLGRYYNVWHPIVPKMWSGHSVLFEVGMCVMVYLSVLYIEFLPIVVERFRGNVSLRGPLRRFDAAVERLLEALDRTLHRWLFLFIIAGVVLSCLHQSSLGGLMLIAPSKVHPLWFTPILPLLFLLSAFCVGFPMVVFESLLVSRGLRREPEMELLGPLARTTPVLLLVYFAFKIGDLLIRGEIGRIFAGDAASIMFLVEILGGVALPAVLLLQPKVRHDAAKLFFACSLVIGGVVLNRINVFLVAYHPPFAEKLYVPSVWEILLSAGMVAGLVIVYRAAVSAFPVLPRYVRRAHPQRTRAQAAGAAVTVGLALLAAGALFPSRANGAAASAAHGKTMDSNCSGCHECDKPTIDDPCLVRCPRQGAHRTETNGHGPNKVILDELVDLYVGVSFDHSTHAKMAGMANGCESCHHYGEPGQPIQACSTCHPAEIAHEDIAQPGLKGAYHRQCLGCHQEWDRDTACEVCHEKRAGGRLQGSATGTRTSSHYSEVEFMELITFEGGGEGAVPFHHKRHSEMYSRSCADCHHEQRCDGCHVEAKVPHPMAAIDRAMHDVCGDCHAMDDTRCSECHGRSRESRFQHASTGFPLRGPHAGVGCRNCHRAQGPFRPMSTACGSCHAVDKWQPASFDHAITGLVLDETHRDLDCADCHAGGVGTKAACDGCHDDARKAPSSGTLR